MNPASIEVAESPVTTRPNILTVQGCSGCGRPKQQRVKTPFGIRRIVNRLKMTRVPGVEAVEQLHPRHAPARRVFPVFAPLCKPCRKTAGADA